MNQSENQLGRYTLIKPLAQGGMAEVWLASTSGASGFQRECVIKRILPEFAQDTIFLRMFTDEARIAAQLNHPNIVQVFDFDQVKDTFYIAMEYVEGCDLRTILETASLEGKTLALSEVLYIMVEVTKALDYAHRRVVKGQPLNIIHRDVSPHNILISYDGVVKLTDFGIAKATNRATRTAEGIVKGKLAYMSPEQAKGQPLDPRSDLFSLGTVFFETVTLRRLFYAEHDRDILKKVMACRVPSPKSYARKLPNDVESVIMKLLARERSRRYKSGGALLAALNKIYMKACQREGNATPQLSLREKLLTLFPNRSSRTSEREDPGSWPNGSAWPGRGGTPVLVGGVPEIAPQPERVPEYSELASAVGNDAATASALPPHFDDQANVATDLNPNAFGPGPSPTSLPAPALNATAFASDDGDTLRTEVNALINGIQPKPNPVRIPRNVLPGVTSAPGLGPMGPQQSSGSGPVAKPVDGPAGGHATPFRRHQVVNADTGESKGISLFQERTKLHTHAPAGPNIRAKRKRWTRLSRRRLGILITIGLLLAIGLLVGLIVASGAPDADVQTPNGTATPNEAAPAASTGTLVIQTVPQGASVTINGQPIDGLTPLHAAVPLGQNTTVSISLEGYYRQSLTVRVDVADEPFEQVLVLQRRQ